jgi:hypothetical protein
LQCHWIVKQFVEMICNKLLDDNTYHEIDLRKKTVQG